MLHIILHQDAHSFKASFVKFHFVLDLLPMSKAPTKYVKEFQPCIERLLPRFGPGKEFLNLVIVLTGCYRYFCWLAFVA